MKNLKTLHVLQIVTAALSGCAALAPTWAVPIEVQNVNMFRETRSVNNVGISAGNRFQYGAEVIGGSENTSISAFYAPTNTVTSTTVCAPLSTSAEFCSGSTAYSASRIAQPWALTFTRSGEASLTVAAPSVAAASVAVPFPTDVTINGAGNSPTIAWSIPGSFVPDAIRINIYDRAVIRANGTADVIHSVALAAGATSYTIPSTLSTGQQLASAGDYVFGVQLIDTRGDPAIFLANNNNAEIIRRSNSFFNFTPLSGAANNVFLPTVSNGVYNFAISNVGPNSVTSIDPIIAVGYDYATGDGNPNFASVIAPTGIGDSLYDLFTWNGTVFIDSGVDIIGGNQYFFASGGVSKFSLRGIETSALLDPNNTSAFVTGLTFISNGSFTGTMTPLTIEISNAVPLPSSFALLGLGFFALLGKSRLQTRIAKS